jgi:hypothetical protein
MALNPHYSQVARHRFLDGITTDLGTSCLLRIYDQTQPTNVATALGAQVLLSEQVCSATFAPGASGGVLTASAITNDSSANATGTAAWGTLCTSAGTRIVDFSVGTSGADCNFNSVAFQSGAVVSVTSFTITMAA